MSDARDKILARRGKFVAAALAGVSIASSEACKPQPCLEVAPQPPDVAPGPCLSPQWVPPVDAAVDDASSSAVVPEPSETSSATGDAGVTRVMPADAGADGGPKIVLPPATRQTQQPYAPPQPCLLMPIMKKK